MSRISRDRFGSFGESEWAGQEVPRYTDRLSPRYDMDENALHRMVIQCWKMPQTRPALFGPLGCLLTAFSSVYAVDSYPSHLNIDAGVWKLFFYVLVAIFALLSAIPNGKYWIPRFIGYLNDRTWEEPDPAQEMFECMKENPAVRLAQPNDYHQVGGSATDG